MSQLEDPRAANRARFELELEFVQSLANPFYLHSLAQQNILNQPAFVNFLKYLLYWKEKDYARFILSVTLPSCRPFAECCSWPATRTRCTTWSCCSMRSSGRRWGRTSGGST